MARKVRKSKDEEPAVVGVAANMVMNLVEENEENENK